MQKFGQILKNWKNFSFDQSSQAEARLEKSGNFQLIENHTQSIEILENWIFWKIADDC